MSIKNNKPKNTKRGWKQGYFKVSNSKKYIEPNKPCIYRSSYEYRFMFWCENNDLVYKWGSESFSIKYLCLSTGKTRNYWIDFVVYIKQPKEKWFVEVKPHKQVMEAIRFGKRLKKMKTNSQKKNFTLKNKTAAKNYSKWTYAKKVAKEKGCVFKIITEKFLKNTYK